MAREKVHELLLEFGNLLPELDQAAETLHRFLDAHRVPAKGAYAIRLALEEIATNIIKFAHDDGARHEITVKVVLGKDAATLTFEDDGREFDPSAPRSIPSGDSIEERPIGGLGIFLVQDMADEVKYRRARGKNVLEVRVQL